MKSRSRRADSRTMPVDFVGSESIAAEKPREDLMKIASGDAGLLGITGSIF